MLHNMLSYVTLYNMLFYATLYNLFLLGYITCYFMLYNMLFYVFVILYLTIIPGGHVGYEMIDSQRGAQRGVGYSHLISNKREWNNCFLKNSHKISLYLPDQNKPEKTRDFRYSHVTRLSKLSTREQTRLDCMNEKSKHCTKR